MSEVAKCQVDQIYFALGNRGQRPLGKHVVSLLGN
jgi:hypothetical protein